MISRIILFISMFGCLSYGSIDSTISVKAKVDIKTQSGGHSILPGSSGFNVRIADKVWNYSHPDFRKGVHELKPGWLRYFSGTMGDAFSSATGQYDYDFAWQFDKQKQYLKGYEFTAVKGPHRLIDLYDLLGEVGGKLVITVNGFTETPQMTAELARFCKNNHIKVEAWQFCNEPYFYVPNRDRYWWNDGYDYAAKMKPHAEAIQSVFPDAKLALNFTWDGIWGFMKDIERYQKENGRYWNVFSKHSYAPHTGAKENLEEAYKRGNTKLVTATSSKAMKKIEDHTWENVPMMITEFGVWNRPLNGIYSSIYNAEYVLRQLEHSNTTYIGAHEVSNKVVPVRNLNKAIVQAFRTGSKIDTDLINTDYHLTDEGKAFKLVNEATNNSSFVFDHDISGGPVVPGLTNKNEQGWYARAFKGNGIHDYLVVTNRSDQEIEFDINIENKKIDRELVVSYFYATSLKEEPSEIWTESVSSIDLVIKPFSVYLIKWKNNRKVEPLSPKIYQSSVSNGAVSLSWNPVLEADTYKIRYRSEVSRYIELITTSPKVQINGLKPGSTIEFQVAAVSDKEISKYSNMVSRTISKPTAPTIFKTSKRFETATVFWSSVPNADGYFVHLIDGSDTTKYDAKNVFGYRIEELVYNKKYQIAVTAYNGIGESAFSTFTAFKCNPNLPIPPRNVSAKETGTGEVLISWIRQDTINSGVKYKVYRGKDPYIYHEIAEGIVGSNFTDQAPIESQKYYSVKSYSDIGETNFFANCATVIPNNNILSLDVKSIEENPDDYLITIEFKNFPTDGDTEFGIALSNVSYLNVEEEKYFATTVSDGEYVVKLDKSILRNQDKYAVKAMIISNGSAQYSKPPYQTLQNR